MQIRSLVLSVLVTTLSIVGDCRAQPEQRPPAGPGQSGMGGIASGVVAAPVYDDQKRPITAGGFVDSGPVVFQDITKPAGLSGWTHKMGVPEKKFIVETNGSGVGLIDYDNDGWLDIYLVNGSTFDALDGKEDAASCGAVPQQSRWNIYRRGREGRRDQRPLGLWGEHCRLRQRRLAGHFCRQLREEPALPQQPRWDVYRCGGKGRA